MFAAEIKRKSCENKSKKMIEEELVFKEAEKERIRKAVQNHQLEKKNIMTMKNQRSIKSIKPLKSKPFEIKF